MGIQRKTPQIARAHVAASRDVRVRPPEPILHSGSAIVPESAVVHGTNARHDSRRNPEPKPHAPVLGALSGCTDSSASRPGK